MSKKLSTLPVGAIVKSVNTKYNGAVIRFKVGRQASDRVGLVTERIISLKCFDAKEPSNSNSDRRNYGNNRAAVANLLQWLNSAAGAGQWYSAQHSADSPPNNANVWSNYNEYEAEAGFLNGFEQDFRDALLNDTITVAKSSTDGGGSEQITRKVRLLTRTEVFGDTKNGTAEGTQVLLDTLSATSSASDLDRDLAAAALAMLEANAAVPVLEQALAGEPTDPEVTRAALGALVNIDSADAYLALVCGEGISAGWIDQQLDGQPSASYVEPLASSDGLTLVAVYLASGRQHQIRRHLAAIGHPLLGDPRYGRGNKNSEGLALQAQMLAFSCPVSHKPRQWYAEPPAWACARLASSALDAALNALYQRYQQQPRPPAVAGLAL